MTSAGLALRSQTLLLLHLGQRKTCTDGDDIQHRMAGVGRHAQSVHLLPGMNSLFGRIKVRALVCQLLAAPLLTFELLFREVLGAGFEIERLRRWCHR